MALTITDEPYDHTPAGQHLIVSATSDNFANDGFKYWVELSVSASVVYTGFISPNPTNALHFLLTPFINPKLSRSFFGNPVHSSVSIQYEADGEGFQTFQVVIKEAWIIDGVLTIDDASEVTTETHISWPAVYQIADGYKPNPATRYGLTGTTQLWLSDRKYNTHRPPRIINMDLATSRVFIPVREADYGVFTRLTGLDSVLKFSVSIFDSAGAPHTFNVDVIDDPMYQLPFYPANLNATAETWEKPSDYPDWRYIQIRALGAADAVVSVNYYLYNVAVFGGHDCIYDVVRLAWQGYGGGWEYFNFTKKSEQSDTIERKTFNKVIGTYAAEDFTFNPFDSGLTQRASIQESFLSFSSDWIQENEYIFLRSLIVSPLVHIVNDDGTLTPCVIEANDYTQVNERTGKMKTLSLKLRYANEFWK